MADRPPDLGTELRDTLRVPARRGTGADELWADVQRRIRRHRRRRRALTGFAAIAVLALAGGAVALVARDDDPASTVDTDPGESAVTTTLDPAIATTTTSGVAPDADRDDTVFLSLEPAPVGSREGHSVTVTPIGVFVWGGRAPDVGGQAFADGAWHDTETEAWNEIAAAPIEPRGDHVAVWTGSELIVWGGLVERERAESTYAVDGAAYDPATQTWRPIPDAPIPADRYDGVWTGSELVVVGGGEATVHAAAYDPATNEWRELPEPPMAIVYPTVLWTGRQVLVVGGERDGDGPESSAVRQFRVLAYEPATDEWSDIGGQQIAPGLTEAAWTEGGLVVWSHQPTDGTWWRNADTGQWRRSAGFPAECEDEVRVAATRDTVIASSCSIVARFNVAAGEWMVLDVPSSAGEVVDARNFDDASSTPVLVVLHRT